MLRIRSETPNDYATIREVNEQAFCQPDEADLVEALRQVADPYVSLVAEEARQVVGHIVFSPVTVEPGDNAPPLMALAPMAVRPTHQKQGIGSALVRDGLEACAALGVAAVVVLGHPDYYPRFGFRPASTFGLRCTYDVPDEVFMALELRPGALADVRGTVHYHPAFNEVA